MNRIEDFENDPLWIRSIGEKLAKIHFRKGHYHAECNPKTGSCQIHYDKHNPYESVESLINHLGDSNLDKVVLTVGGIAVLDQLLTGGQLRKSIGDIF